MFAERRYVYDACSLTLASFLILLVVQPCPALRLYSVLKQPYPVITQLTTPVIHGEGPHWDAIKKVVYFVDIAGRRVYQYNQRTTELTFVSFDEDVGAVFPIESTSNKFFVGVGTTLTEVTWNGENTTNPCVQKLHTVDVDKVGNRFNDGKVDSVGRLWLGTMGEENPIGTVKLYQGTLYRLSKESCRLEPVITNVSISNGIVWSFDDRHMFYIDTPTRQVIKYDYDIFDGSIKNGRILIDFEAQKLEGFPDGMTIDNDDNLWIACWNGSQIVKVCTLTGEVLTRIKMAVPRVTSVTFGDSFQTLYVTTSRLGLSRAELQKYPSSGALFSISNLNVIGHPNNAASNCLDIDHEQCFYYESTEYEKSSFYKLERRSRVRRTKKYKTCVRMYSYSMVNGMSCKITNNSNRGSRSKIAKNLSEIANTV